ncbi:unnamed protein product [Miscanthus lutarioriparius]|uniref:Uncharacterized protein n=1 Tax=Miscanthus lutarioriparius TaxID=422564 RepID=A0A811QNB2_9POAL|nr:unnamed protein product [Miscanthus lutarioriparius]
MASRRGPQPEQEAAGGGRGGAEATRRRPRGWRAVAFIIGVYAAAYIAGNAFSFSLTSYLIGRYNMKQNAATNVNNVFSGTFNFAPVVGAFVADAFWGRFRTLLFGRNRGRSCCKFLPCDRVTCFLFSDICKPPVETHAMAVITLSATIHQLKPPTCSPTAQQAGTCVAPSALQRAVLYLGMGLHVVSAGGMNPTSLPFGADQFDERKEHHKGGLTRFYNWYYAVAMVATFLALTVVLYVQVSVSWGLGLAIPTALMAVAFVVFLVGTKVYVYVPPEGSIFSSVARVFVASCRKWRLPLPHPEDARRQEELLYNPPAAVGNGRRVFKLPLTLQLSFLNKAAIVTDAADEIRRPGEAVEPVQRATGGGGQVPPEDHPRVDLRHPVHFTIPPASIVAVLYLSVVLFVPVYDLLIVRAARRVTKAGRGITLLQRQGAGLVVGALAFVVAAAVERRRRHSALAHVNGMSPLSVFLLAPQLAVMGVSGGFSMVGQTKFYNTQFPDQMRTLANAAFYCAQGVSSYLATLVVNIVNARTRQHGGSAGWVTDDINAGRIDYFYYAMVVLTGANFVYLLVCSHFYQYKGEQAAETPAGREPVTDSGSLSESDATLLKT